MDAITVKETKSRLTKEQQIVKASEATRIDRVDRV
jgi:hypothetical protein